MTMKKYRETIAAGSMLEIEHPASFFTLLRAFSPVDVEFLKDYRVADRAEQMVAGLWFEPEGGFDRVRVWNSEAYDVTVEFLLSRGRSGWSMPPPSCHTDIISLSGVAASAVVPSGVFDLGDDWAAVVLTAQVEELTASAGGSLAIYCSDVPAMANQRLCVGQGHTTLAYVATSSTNHHLPSMRPTGRFVRARFANGATPQAVGTARMALHVMRNLTA